MEFYQQGVMRQWAFRNSEKLAYVAGKILAIEFAIYGIVEKATRQDGCDSQSGLQLIHIVRALIPNL